MALGADDVEAAEFADALAKLNVGTAPRHVGGDGDAATLAGARDDLRLLLVILGVKHGVDHARALEHAGEKLGGLDCDRADQHGLTALVRVLDFLNDGGVFVAAGFENTVVAIDADAGTVRRHHLHAEAVDILELHRLGFGGAGHAGEFFVEAEIVLDRDRGIGPRLAFDRNIFFGLDRLMQSVRPAATGHDAARVFIDDHDLALLDDVFDVAFVERIGAQELRDGVDVLRNGGVAILRGELLLFALFRGNGGGFLNVAELGREIGQHEGIRVVGTQLRATELREVSLVLALVDDVEELFLQLVELVFVEVGIEIGLGLVEELPPRAIFHQAEELFVLRVTHFHLQHLLSGERFVVVSGTGVAEHGLGRSALRRGRAGVLQKRFGRRALIAGRGGLLEQFLRLSNDLDAKARLIVDELIDRRKQACKRLLTLDGGGSGNDQRCAGLIDEDRVDFIDDAEPVITLHLVFLARRHAVVAEVVEAELARGAVSNVAAVHIPPEIRRHLLLDTAHGHSEKIVDVAHPLGVAAGEVVVDGNELGILAGQGIEVKGQRGDEGLALAGRHFGDHAFVNRHTADQLDVEMNHVPGQLVFADENLPPAKPAGGTLHRREGLRENVLQGGALISGRGDPHPEFLRLGAQLVVSQRLIGHLNFIDARDDGAALLKEFFIVPSRKAFKEKREHEYSAT